MKKLVTKILSVLIIAAMVLLLCGCDALQRAVHRTIMQTLELKDPDIADGDDNPYLNVDSGELTFNEGYEPVTSRYSYNALPLEGERVLYDKLVESFFEVSSVYSEKAEQYPMPEVYLEGYSLSEAQVRTTMKAISDDRPDLFWPSNTVGYYADDSKTIVQVYSRLSPEEVSARLSAVRQAANDFYATVPDGLTEYQRELRVHDFLAELTEYDADVDVDNTENNDPELYTVYGAMVNRLTVCEGYARAFQLLLNGLGVDCVNITGRSDNELHMWNEVKLGDLWYAVDLTWDDREESYSRYCYFNLTSEQMARDHENAAMFTELSDDQINGQYENISANVMNLFIPECVDPTMSWFYRETAHLDDYDGVDVKNALLAAARNSDQYFVFYIGEGLDYEEAVNGLFKEAPQYFFDYIISVNGYLEDYSIDTSNVGYISMTTNRAVTVELHYY